VDQRVLNKVDLIKAAFADEANHAVVSKELPFLHRHLGLVRRLRLSRMEASVLIFLASVGASELR